MALGLGACGATYSVPDASSENVARAEAIFQQERGTPSSARKSPSAAANQYLRVVSRVEPVAEKFCRTQTADKPAFDCDVQVLVDPEQPDRNAFQLYGPNNEPIVVFTIPFIADARNEDELAFVLGHEFGHHIATHI